MDNDHQDSEKLTMSKFQANGARYFGLFDPHIPTGLTGNVLLLSLSNTDCVAKTVRKNPVASYTVVDDVWTLNCLRALPPSEKMYFIEDLDIYNIIKGLDMKFDCIIMNPPYRNNLHLKILAEAIKHLKDDGVCVNLSPVRWLQDPLAKYKKQCDLKRFEESVTKHIKALDVVDKNISRELFNNGLNQDCGIYVCSHQGGFDVSSAQNFLIRRLIDRIVAQHRPKIDVSEKDGWRVRIPMVMGGSHTSDSRKDIIGALRKILYFKDGKKDGQPWYSFFQKTGNTKATPEITASIQLNSEMECMNYVDSLKTSFCLFFISECMTSTGTQFASWPWMGDVVNPRTGLKGYQGEWIDNDFYKFFNITSEEQKVIEETMEKYK